MKKTLLLAMLTLATVSYGTMAVAQEIKPQEITPDIPPPPPPPPVEKKAQNKAAKIHQYAEDVVKKHKAYEDALQKALANPEDEGLKKDVKKTVNKLAEAIDTLMRNVKSLEQDIKKLVEGIPSGEIKSFEKETKKVKKVTRNQSEVDLIKELEERFKNRLKKDESKK